MTQQPTNYWIWITRGSCAACLVFVLAGILLQFLPKISEHERSAARLAELKETELELRNQRDSLRHQKVLLQSDAQFIEQKVRDRLNKKKAGEEIFRFGSAEEASAQR